MRTAAHRVSAATIGSMQHQRRRAERRVAKPCTRVLVHAVVPRRGPPRLLSACSFASRRAPSFLHLVREGGAKGGCSTTDRGKTRPLSSGPSLLLLLLLRLLLRLLLCCSARTVYLRFQSLRRRLDESLRPSGAAHSELLERRGSCDARTSTESAQGCASRQAESGAWRYRPAALRVQRGRLYFPEPRRCTSVPGGRSGAR